MWERTSQGPRTQRSPVTKRHREFSIFTMTANHHPLKIDLIFINMKSLKPGLMDIKSNRYKNILLYSLKGGGRLAE